jgi:membrane-bound inhibitor of C-type lysozyme
MRLALPLTLVAASAAGQDAPTAFLATYICAGGARLEVAYLNPPGIASLAVVLHKGRLVPMQAGPTGSGVRYVTLGDGAPLVWHTKGKKGFLAREDAAETMQLTDCRTDDAW